VKTAPLNRRAVPKLLRAAEIQPPQSGLQAASRYAVVKMIEGAKL
jgi:hypothetical protein